MALITRHLLIMAALMTSQPAITVKVDHKFMYYHVPQFSNICLIEDRRALVHCYCDTPKPNMAKQADCWIFTVGITPEDHVWPNFSSQSKIEHLVFNVRSDDALTFIPAKAIIRLESLRYFSIQFGTIETIPSYAFTNSSSIRQINLRTNKIYTLERHSFAQMMMLGNLSLDDNHITELRRDVFFNLPNLHILHISNNNVSFIQEGCFKHLNSLIELNLDFNLISVVTREMFEGLENLSRLNLQNNRLSMIGNLAFSEMWGLKELRLDHNAIEYVPARAFGGLAELRKLTLAGNKFKTLYDSTFDEMTSLIVLDLRDNLLLAISYETIRPIAEKGISTSSAVYLDGNPLQCDCRLSWIYLLRNETKDNTLRHALEKVSCITEVVENLTEEPNKVNDYTQEETNYDDEYNDEMEDSNKKETLIGKYINLIDIPLDTLPCPKELMRTIEDTYGYPIQHEIRTKAYSKGLSSTPCLILLLMVMQI